ncbi:MAG: UbiA family prenyltransferase, partial [Longimicrobiales bacterium]
CVYSYTKRFTELAHLVLGLSLGIAPVGAYLAVTGAWSEPWWALPLLAAAVMLWVAGFDIIYSLQDVEFDRLQRLRSVPARIGVANALRLARASHAAAVVAFGSILFAGWIPVGWVYLAGVGVMAVVLHLGHATIGRPDRPDLDVRTIDRAFFRTNVIVSSAFFAFTLLDRLIA